MDLPMRRPDEGHRPDQEFERLRPEFATQLERWPDFVRSLQRTLDDVTPLADVVENDDSYVLDVELPGVRREDVDLRIDRGRLVVTAARRERQRVGLLRHRTRTTGRFALSVTLPGAIDHDGVSASLDHGVLTIVVPKSERARRRHIPIGQR